MGNGASASTRPKQVDAAGYFGAWRGILRHCYLCASVEIQTRLKIKCATEKREYLSHQDFRLFKWFGRLFNSKVQFDQISTHIWKMIQCQSFRNQIYLRRLRSPPHPLSQCLWYFALCFSIIAVSSCWLLGDGIKVKACGAWRPRLSLVAVPPLLHLLQHPRPQCHVSPQLHRGCFFVRCIFLVVFVFILFCLRPKWRLKGSGSRSSRGTVPVAQ